MKLEVPQRMPAPERGPSGVQVMCAGNMCSQCSPLFCHFCEIRYRRGASGVRKTHSVRKKGSWCTRRVFKYTRCKNRLLRYGREIRCKKRASGVPNASSKARNILLLHRTHFQRPAEQPTPQTVKGLLVYRTHLRKRKKQPPLEGEQI